MAWKWPWPKGREASDVRPELKSARGSGFIAIHAQSEARWTRRDYAALAREGYMRNPVAHRCVRLICEASSAVPLLLYAGATEYDAHPALDLLARPNQRQAGGSFLEALYGNLLLAGNAYVELIETGSGLRELHLLRPDRVTILADAGGWPTALEYREGSTKRKIGLSGGGEGRALHLSLFHPLDDHYGFPPLEAALMALDTHNAAGQWNKALLDNSARPGKVRREVGLGSVLDVSLEKAREKAAEFRKAAADGKDVLEVKRVERSLLNFRQAADTYVAAMKEGWKNSRTEGRWLQILEIKEVAELNLRPVRDVNVQDVLRAVTPLWQMKPTTAKFLIGMIKRTLAWASAHGHRDPNIANPADWNLTLKYVMSAPKRGGNFAAMPYADLPNFVQTLRNTDTVYARALEFIILTWARKREVLDMVWSEIDLDGAIWTVPAERIKGGVTHQVPLTKRALEILRAQRVATARKGLVFPSAVNARPFGDTTLGRLIPRPHTLHGFRSAARDWAGDMTPHEREVAEMCLAHAVGDSVERAYRRGTALAKRGALLHDWSLFLQGDAR